MLNLALSSPTIHFNASVLGAVGYVELNYHEVQCLDMCLYFLTSQVVAARPHKLFTQLRKHHVDHLSDWLRNNTWRYELRFDGQNSYCCPLESLEDAKWFALACEIGICEDTIMSMAADDANVEIDMARMYAEEEYNDELYREAYISSYRAFHNHYCKIAKLSQALANKFQQILN